MAIVGPVVRVLRGARGSALGGAAAWRRRFKPSPVQRVAAGLYGTTGVAAAIWASTNVADDWMTNVGTSAFFGAITITVIDRAIRDEARQRVAPRVAPVIGHITTEFGAFVESVAVDYAATHSRAFKQIPRGLLEVLDLWLDEQDTADMPHGDVGLPGETLGVVGINFVSAVTEYDASDRDVLDPEFVAAIRLLQSRGSQAEFWLRRKLHPNAPPEIVQISARQRRAYRQLVLGAREFGDVLRRYVPDGVTFELNDQAIEVATAFRDDVLAARE